MNTEQAFCEHGIRDLATNVPYCRRCDDESKGSANCSANEAKYNPVQCLSDEVKRFKATNRFTPMQVTGFYIQAAVVLDYVRDLEETLDRLTLCAEYVCAHQYGERDPVGTRIVAVSDLNAAVRHARRMHRWPNGPDQRPGANNLNI